MTLLSKIEEIFVDVNMSCPECGFQPENPKQEFSVDSSSRMNSDFTKYNCPECEHTFQAVICDCGRGYQSRMSFDKVEGSLHGGQETYKCDCGEVLHVHQRH